MSASGDVGGASGVKGAPQGKRVPLSSAESKELLKPIVFGNHQTKFKVFTAIVSAAMTYYMVFKHDFGPNRHIFTWLREWKERKTKEIFYIDPDDGEVQRMRERRQETAATSERTNEHSVTMAMPQTETEIKDNR